MPKIADNVDDVEVEESDNESDDETQQVEETKPEADEAEEDVEEDAEEDAEEVEEKPVEEEEEEEIVEKPKKQTKKPAAKKTEKANKTKTEKAEKTKKVEKPKKQTKKTASDDDEPKKRHVSAVTPSFIKAVTESIQSQVKNEVVKDICETFVKVLIEKVMEGETVQFTNHFVFKMKTREGRNYRVPNKDKNAPPRTVAKPDRYAFSMTVRPGLKKLFDTVEVTDELTEKITKTKKTVANDEEDTE